MTSSVIPVAFPQAREIVIDADRGTYASPGRDASGEPVFILTFAKVSMPALPLAEPETAIVLTSGETARRMEAIASQGELPLRARAVFEDTHWRVLSLAHA